MFPYYVTFCDIYFILAVRKRSCLKLSACNLRNRRLACFSVRPGSLVVLFLFPFKNLFKPCPGSKQRNRGDPRFALLFSSVGDGSWKSLLRMTCYEDAPSGERVRESKIQKRHYKSRRRSNHAKESGDERSRARGDPILARLVSDWHEYGNRA